MAVYIDGKPVVIPNHIGEMITPSVVGILEDGSIAIGEQAREQLIVRPNETVMEVKRLMGTSTEIRLGDKMYNPQQISSLIIKYLKECAEEYLGEEVNRAVISVPAYFTDEQRKATVEAGELAGLTVERIINEPTAAALSYGIEHMDENSHVLVYDLGGGTLDVTLLEMFDGVLEVKASSGNNKLGGKDFDEKIMNLLIEDFRKKYAVDLSKDIRAVARLKDAAEKCKIQLSTEPEYRVTLPFIHEKNGNALGLDKAITRTEFENLISNLIDSTKEQIDIALSDGDVSYDDIDIVLLVGGSTRIPYVTEFIKKTFGQTPKELVDPDLAVVIGAAVQASVIENEALDDNGIIITDVCPYTLGIEIMSHDEYGFPVFDVYDVVIPRNLTIPVFREKTYYTAADYQTEVEIKVYQGDHRKASMNVLLGNFILGGIPPAKAGSEKVKVKFMYDINGILQVEATVLSNGKHAQITIEATGVKAEKEVDLSDWEASPKAKRYRGIIKRAEKALDEKKNHDLYDELVQVLLDFKDLIVHEGNDDELSELEEKMVDLLYEMEDED